MLKVCEKDSSQNLTIDSKQRNGTKTTATSRLKQSQNTIQDGSTFSSAVQNCAIQRNDKLEIYDPS